MSDDEGALHLNTIDRFTKLHALVLQEYSHCEMPAGCGGLVLRWSRRSAACR